MPVAAVLNVVPSALPVGDMFIPGICFEPSSLAGCCEGAGNSGVMLLVPAGVELGRADVPGLRGACLLFGLVFVAAGFLRGFIAGAGARMLFMSIPGIDWAGARPGIMMERTLSALARGLTTCFLADGR